MTYYNQAIKIQKEVGARDFSRVACAEVTRVTEMVSKVLDTCVQAGNLTEQVADKLMIDWVKRVNARMSVASDAPNGTTKEMLVDKLIINIDENSFGVDKADWAKKNEDEKKEFMKAIAEKSQKSPAAYCVDASQLTIGQLESCLIGNIPVCLNAAKHIEKGKLKEVKKGTEGYLRKFSICPKDDPIDAIKLISHKTFIRWLNDIIGTDGKLIHKFQESTGKGAISYKEWVKPMKGKTKGQKVMVFEQVLVQLIGCLRTFKPTAGGLIKCGVYKPSAEYAIFGCLQVAKTNFYKVGNMIALSAELKESYVNSNTMIQLPATK